MHRIAAVVAEEYGALLRADETQLRAGVEAGLPVPVLSVSRANSLESPWTEYLAHMCDPGSSGAIGAVLGPAIFEFLSSTAVDPGELVVLSEVQLGVARCEFCNQPGETAR